MRSSAHRRTIEEAFDTLFALSEVATQTPEPLSGPRDTSGNLDPRYCFAATLAVTRLVGHPLTPLDSGAKVVVLGFETIQPEGATGPAKVRPGELGEFEEE